MAQLVVLAALCFSAVTAFPKEVVFGNLGSDLRYQHIQAKKTRLIDSWLPEILEDLPIYVPSRDNEFHLFTRDNPTTSQPLLTGNALLLQQSNFSPTRRTVVLIHGYQGSAYSNSNLVLIPAYLAAADVNVVVVDWSRGANSSPIISSLYAAMSSVNVGRFVYWLSQSSGQQLSEFTLVGIGLSALKTGLIGRLLRTEGVTLGHIVALDPAFGPRIHELFPTLRPTDADYVEVVHTNVGNLGFIKPMGQVDFYPNSGLNMPGCGRDDECDRNRAFFFWAESLTSGGFTGIQCEDYEEALNLECEGPSTLQMGGVDPKPGAVGVYSLRTNAAPPFSLD